MAQRFSPRRPRQQASSRDDVVSPSSLLASSSSSSASSSSSSPPPSSSSSSYALRRHNDLGVEGPQPAERMRAHPRLGSQLPSLQSSLYAGDLYDSALGEERIRARRARDDLAALVDFLDNHPPPPENFMSIPYPDEKEDGWRRWTKIRKKSMAKRSTSVTREPQHIRLPDSAVAGVTTDGHRHIAISIPWEAMPLDPEMPSDHPASNTKPRAGAPGKDLVRTYRNEKGVVTVLRPVIEARETSDRPATQKRPPHAYVNSRGHAPPPLPPHKPTSSAGSLTYDYIGVLPTSFGNSLLDDGSAPWHTPRTSLVGEMRGQDGRDQETFQKSGYPVRVSSMAALRPTRGRDAPLMENSAMQHSHQGPAASASTKHNSKAEGDSVDMTSQADKTDRRLTPKTPNALCSQHSCPDLKRNGSQGCVSSSAMDEVQDEPRPSTLRSKTTTSRKALVRDKKRRDLEAMRHARLKGEHDGRKPGRGKEDQRPQTAHASLPSGGESKPAGTASASGPALTMSSLMVVMDMQPTSDAEPERTDPPAMTRQTRKSNVTTEPEGQMALETVRAVGAGTRHVAPADETREEDEEEEEPRPHEACRDDLLRDMEQRLRKLEQNGDVWLQALVPVLASMNRNLGVASDETPRRTKSSGGELQRRRGLARSQSLFG